MKPEEFEYLYQLEEKFWWFVAMREITDAVASPAYRAGGSAASLKILDAGCGTGYNLGHFATLGPHSVFGFDISAGAIDGVRKRGLKKVTQASITEIPYASETFDVVYSFEVISQGLMPSVEKCLSELHRVVKPGGYLFLRAPAYQWMTSSHDTGVDTVRRFTRSGLNRQLEAVGMRVEWSSYANCFLFPAVVARRMLKGAGVGAGSDVRPLPSGLGWIDPLFRGILSSEAALFRQRIPLPFGLSIVCLSRRP